MLLLGIAGFAAAQDDEGGDEAAECVTVGDSDDIYYVCDDGTVWKETNGRSGLQRTGNWFRPADTEIT
jgi:hypothetical protein